jgi:hypothetical protein
MPLRLNVGVSKKLGLPNYSSIGASCNLEVELETNLLRDLDGLHAEARGAFIAAQQAVNDELARLQAQAQAGAVELHEAVAVNGHHRNGVPLVHDRPAPPLEAVRARPSRPATPSQVKAIVAIARKQRADLDGLLCDLGVTRPEELSLAEASRLIDQLKLAGQI